MLFNKFFAAIVLFLFAVAAIPSGGLGPRAPGQLSRSWSWPTTVFRGLGGKLSGGLSRAGNGVGRTLERVEAGAEKAHQITSVAEHVSGTAKVLHGSGHRSPTAGYLSVVSGFAPNGTASNSTTSVAARCGIPGKLYTSPVCDPDDAELDGSFWEPDSVSFADPASGVPYARRGCAVINGHHSSGCTFGHSFHDSLRYIGEKLDTMPVDAFFHEGENIVCMWPNARHWWAPVFGGICLFIKNSGWSTDPADKEGLYLVDVRRLFNQLWRFPYADLCGSVPIPNVPGNCKAELSVNYRSKKGLQGCNGICRTSEP